MVKNPKRQTIAVVINTLNAERIFDKCLDSVSWADEIVVCDMYSDDKTVEIAHKYGARVYFHERCGYVEPARNFANSKVQSDWLLVLDADEMTANVNGEAISVTVREFNILYKLLSYPKKTFSRSQLLDEFWGVDSSTSLRSVDVYITKLREKFACCEDFKIVTIHGLGYKAVLK